MASYKTPTQHLAKLVAIPSITGDPVGAKKVFDYIESHLAGLPLDVRRYVSNGFESLVALTPGATKKRTLWLVGHVDTVVAEAHMYKLTERNGKLVGRGSLDNKCAAAAFIGACETMGNDLRNHSFGIMLSSDEEIGGINGTGHLLNSLGYRGEVAFVPDSGTSWSIESRTKGLLHLKIEAKGKAGHGALPWQGDNAIDRLVQFIGALRTELSIPDHSEARRHYLPTLNVGTISGGEKTNQIADYASATVDIRFPEISQLNEFTEAIAILQKRHSKIRITSLATGQAVHVQQDNPWLIAYSKILNKYQFKPRPRKSCGTTDARHFAAHGIPTIVSQPHGGGVHGPNEWIEKNGPDQLTAVARDLILCTGDHKTLS